MRRILPRPLIVTATFAAPLGLTEQPALATGDPGELSAEYDDNSGQLSIPYDGGYNLEVTSTNGIPPCDPTFINVGDLFIVDGIFQFSPPASIHHDH